MEFSGSCPSQSESCLTYTVAPANCPPSSSLLHWEHLPTLTPAIQPAFLPAALCLCVCSVQLGRSPALLHIVEQISTSKSQIT